MKVCLTSCNKAKKLLLSAREIYPESNIFRLSIEYAEKICDKIFILSAKHGLLSLADKIYPYDGTLVNKFIKERKNCLRKQF